MKVKGNGGVCRGFDTYKPTLACTRWLLAVLAHGPNDAPPPVGPPAWTMDGGMSALYLPSAMWQR